jgi:hypothetical protein
MEEELANLGGHLAHVQPPEGAVLQQQRAMLLLHLPQLREDVERVAEIPPPMLLAQLRHMPQLLKQALALRLQPHEPRHHRRRRRRLGFTTGCRISHFKILSKIPHKILIVSFSNFSLVISRGHRHGGTVQPGSA